MSALAFPRRTVRLRLTLVYLGLFVVSAACLLVITYVLVAHQLSGDSVPWLSVSATNGSISISGVGGAACGQITSSSTPPPPAALTTCLVSLQQQARDAALDQLLIESGVALGIMAMASVGLGWANGRSRAQPAAGHYQRRPAHLGQQPGSADRDDRAGR
jgi:hypothetical protein